MDQTAVISLLAVILSLATVFIVQIRRANTASRKHLRRRLMGHRALAELEYGDVIELCAEAKAATRNHRAGGVAKAGSGQVAQGTDRTHSGVGK